MEFTVHHDCDVSQDKPTSVLNYVSVLTLVSGPTRFGAPCATSSGISTRYLTFNMLPVIIHHYVICAEQTVINRK